MTKPKIERIKSGISGLDSIIEGGFVKGFSTLISGSAGTGKTIFCSQFLWEGLKQGENCMFITFEERPEKIRNSALDFGWDFSKYEDKDKMFIEHKNPFKRKGEDLFWFRDEIKEKDIERVALDSVSLLSLYYQDKYDVRKNIFNLVKMLEREGTTSVLTSEIPEGRRNLSRFGVVEFLVDGVIILKGIGIAGEMGRRLMIKKMRRTSFEEDIFPIEFTEKGLTVHRPEKGVKL